MKALNGNVYYQTPDGQYYEVSVAEKSDLRYHGKPNVAENVLEDQITRACWHAWELIKRPRELWSTVQPTEEAIPWATETANVYHRNWY